ncbi:MAG: ATP-binding protein, partial [Acidimicrobiia bacterium]
SVEWAAVPDRPSAATAPAHPAGPPTPRGPRLVGRAPEVAVLDAELERSRAGDFRCVLLVGEPGVGKTRLTAELLAGQGEGVLVLTSRAYPMGAAAAFGLWAEALESHLRELDPAEVVELCGHLLDDLSGLVRTVAAVRGSGPEREPPRTALLEGLAVVLGNLARRTAVVVVLDDVHLADASSWDALFYLARNLREARVMVVAAARPVELGEHPVANQVLLGLDEEGFLRRLDLRPLERDGLVDLAGAILGQAPPEALVDWLDERARGNALFTIGLLRALVEEGADMTAPRLRKLPEGLAERVRARLDVLDRAPRATLEVLATVGSRVELGDLLRLTGRELDDLSDDLDALVRARLVSDEERGRHLTYEMTHPLIAEAIYHGIGAARRRSLHRTVGRALVEMGSLGEAAPHFAQAAEVGDPEAVDVLRQAMHQAEERGAYRESLTLLAGLVELLPEDDRRWLEILDAMSATAGWVVEHRADAHALPGISALQAIDALLEGSPDLARRAAVKFRLATFLAWGPGEFEEALSLSRTALELCQELGDEAMARVVSYELAWQRVISDDLGAMDEAWPVAEAAEAAGDRFLAMQVIGGIGNCATYRGRFADAEVALRRAIRIAKEDGHVYRFTWGCSALALSLGFEGRLEEAFPLIEEGKTFNPDYRDSLLVEWRAVLCWLAGDFAEGLVAAREVAVWNPQGLSPRRAIGASMGVLCAIETRALPEAAAHLERARAAYPRPWMSYSRWCDWAEAALRRAQGDLTGWRALLVPAAQRLVAMEALPFAAPPLLDLAEGESVGGDAAAARRAADQLDRVAERLDRPLYFTLAALAGAWADLAAGHHRLAAEAAAQAAGVFAELGYGGFHRRAADLAAQAAAGAQL